MLNRRLVYEFDALIPRNTPSFLLDYVEPKKGDAILDVGCGNGGLVAKLRELGCDAEGIDLSVIRGIGHKWTRVADIETAELPKGRYGIIFASEVLEHLKDPHRAVRNFHSALRDGGTLVVMLPKEDVLRKIRFKSIKRLRHYICDDLVGGQHLHAFTPDSAKEMLSGFDIVRLDDLDLHFVIVAKKAGRKAGTKAAGNKSGRAAKAVKK